MFRGSDYAKELFENNIDKPIMVYFDPDVDGLISGLLVCRYLSAMGLEYSYYINQDRKHGFLLSPEAVKGYIVIAVDFSISDTILNVLKSQDTVCINIDHHELGKEFISWDKGVVINNQYAFEPEDERYLSGAGMVYYVLCHWNEYFATEENEALVGVTLLSDARPIENSKARYFLTKTYNISTEDGYFKYIVDNTIKKSYGFGAPKVDRNYIDFVLSPRINSMLRFNESFEAIEFILGLGMHTEDKSELQAKFVQYIIEKASISDMTHLLLIEVNYEDIIDFKNEKFPDTNINPANFIGLACSRIKDRGKDAIITLYKESELVRGSFRGKFDGIDYLQIFKNLGCTGAGHKGAFGIHTIKTDSDFLSAINKAIGTEERGFEPTAKIIEVDNLATFCLSGASRIAINNNYVRDAYRTYVRYKGSNIRQIKSGEKYFEYLVDGTRVKAFENLDVREGLILPITEKGYTTFYLRNIIL